VLSGVRSAATPRKNSHGGVVGEGWEICLDFVEDSCQASGAVCVVELPLTNPSKWIQLAELMVGEVPEFPGVKADLTR